MRKIYAGNINRAAFYTYWGAKVLGVEGRPPENVYVLGVSWWMRVLENLGFVRYRKYANQRSRLKRLARRRAGQPEKYMSQKPKGFKFSDIATVRLSKR